eukprot:scaffold89385_cov18-Prasinocladus_malaysianus.AAC.1
MTTSRILERAITMTTTENQPKASKMTHDMISADNAMQGHKAIRLVGSGLIALMLDYTCLGGADHPTGELCRTYKLYRAGSRNLSYGKHDKDNRAE